MDSLTNLLKTVLSDELLDNLIQTCQCVDILNSLLQIKHQRIQNSLCKKITFSNYLIYNHSINTELAVQILKNALSISVDSKLPIEYTTNYCLDKLKSSQDKDEVYYALNLLNVVLEFYKNEKQQFRSKFDDVIVNILKQSSKPVVTYTLLYVVPNYLSVIDGLNADNLLKSIFQFIKTNKNLDILCMCYNTLNKPEKATFNLLDVDDFWILLTECLVDKQSFLKKQAMYLLSKSIEASIETNNFHEFLLENSKSRETWRNYLILLEVSNEKQLHIIEPSLGLFESIKNLNFLWRLCLYKIFLNHMQNTVVYYTAMFILQNETEWTQFSQIIKELLIAVNKNDYCSNSKMLFNKFGIFCNKFNNNQFECILDKSLEIPWVPSALWSFVSNLFNKNNFNFPLNLLESIIKKIKQIPHKFIRNACIKIALNHFIKFYIVETVHDFTKILILLQNDNILDESVLGFFVESNKNKFKFAKSDLIFLCKNSENFELNSKVLSSLVVDIVPEKESYSVDNDILYLFKQTNNTELENYVLARFDSIEDSEDITFLLLLINKINSEKLVEKAVEVVLEPIYIKYNTNQKIASFAALPNNSKNINNVIEFWKDRFLISSESVNERISHYFVKITAQSDYSLNDEFIPIFEKILESENDASITILENILLIFKRLKNTNFLKNCLNQYLILLKNGIIKKTSTKLILTQIFSLECIKDNHSSELLFDFSKQLLVIANSSNSLACFLSKKITSVTSEMPQNCVLFVPVIVELILYGVITNKNERVEYSICQEIGSLIPIENNPNFEATATRLCAIESMVILVNAIPSVCEDFVFLFHEKYVKYFSKRYFPDSQIHLEKLRILQSLLLLHKHIKSEKLIELIIESFILEIHQPSIKHLMQCLLILLSKETNTQRFIGFICKKLKGVDNNKPSTVSNLIPVLYHLVDSQNSGKWDQIVEILLPYTMGAQFKLRIFAQVALLKIYEKAKVLNNLEFLQKYSFMYSSIKEVIEATNNASYDLKNIYHDFLDYISLENFDFSVIFHTIPKSNGVSETEWKNLQKVAEFHNLKYVNFSHDENEEQTEYISAKIEIQKTLNIQKKITPWKEKLEEVDSPSSDFILITSLIEKATNLGGLSRTCEVFGIKKMIMRTSKITSDKEFKSLSMSSENWVDITEVKTEDLKEFILNVKKQEFTVVGAEQTAESVKLDKFQFTRKTALLLGNEKEGISPDLIPLLDFCIEIPQFGMVRSLNVHVAGAIVMWEYCKQHKL